MIALDHKAYFWKEFDGNNNPVNPKECQLFFSPESGGKISYLVDIGIEFTLKDHKNEKIEKLYGQAKGGEKFTLLNLTFSGLNNEFITNGIEFVEAEYFIEYIYYGTWIKNEDLLLSDIHVRYSYLEAWFSQMHVAKPIATAGEIITNIIIEKDKYKCSTKDYEIIFNIDNVFNQHATNGNTVVCESKNFLAMTKKNLLYLGEAISLAMKVKSFFEILTFYSNRKIFIEEFVTQKDETIGDYTNKKAVYILFKQEEYREEEQISSIDFLFRYNNVKENFVPILNNWIENHDKNQNEYQAFCNVIADKTSKFNIYSHYFQLISALEAYHRLQNKNNEEQDEQKHKDYLNSLQTQLSSCLNSGEKKKILYKLKYSYGTSFKDRLKNLIEISQIKEIINFDNSINENIVEFIYKMRNQIAHLKNEMEINQQIKSSFEYLKLVALLIMLKDISLDHVKISKNIFDVDIEYLEKQIIETFAGDLND